MTMDVYGANFLAGARSKVAPEVIENWRAALAAYDGGKP